MTVCVRSDNHLRSDAGRAVLSDQIYWTRMQVMVFRLFNGGRAGGQVGASVSNAVRDPVVRYMQECSSGCMKNRKGVSA